MPEYSPPAAFEYLAHEAVSGYAAQNHTGYNQRFINGSVNLTPSQIDKQFNFWRLGEDTLRSLIWEAALSIAATGAKKRFLFFAPYLPFQRYLGCYSLAFGNGVVLGYAFRDRLATFAKLFSEPGREQELITLMQGLAQQRLAEVGEVRDFLALSGDAEEHRIKADWREQGFTEPQIEHLTQHYRVPLETASGNLHVAVSTGIGFGSTFPELTERLWKHGDELFEEWRKAGRLSVLGIPDGEKRITLEDEQERLLPLVEMFVSKARPDLLPQFKIPR